MIKYVLVPESDLDELEKSRKQIYEMLENYSQQFQTIWLSKTGPMYRLAHRRYRRFPWFWRKR